MRQIDCALTVQDLARGAVLLGTGGGGDPYIGELFLREHIRQGRFPTLVAPEAVADDAFVVSVAGIGAPTVIVEHLVSERTLTRLLHQAEAFYDRRIDYLISAEIGGANSVFPLALSAISGIPVIDADGVGRAVPQLEMTTFSINGVRATPCIVMDDAGNVVTLDAVSDRTAENICRALTAAMGSLTFGVLYPMTGRQMRESSVQGTITQSVGIGRAIRLAREEDSDVFASLLAYLNGLPGRHAKILFDGRIVDVTHETREGWHFGVATMQGNGEDGGTFTVDIRNEFIIARRDGRPATVVPDLIAILDRESAEPLTGEMLSYGQRVKVLGLTADPMLVRPESLDVLGPRCFGLDMDYTPLTQLP